MIAIRKILVVLAALVLGTALGYVTGPLTGRETIETALIYIVLAGIAVVLVDACRRVWRWWRAL